MIGKNNPLNIRYNPKNKWIGQTGQNKGFCCFDTLEHCIRAVAYLLMISYRKRGIVTYHSIIDTYAPSSENPTFAYESFVCGRLHVFPWDELKTVGNYVGLIRQMWFFEQGVNSSVSLPSWILDVINKYNLKLYELK